jgi:hypothetical protein
MTAGPQRASQPDHAGEGPASFAADAAEFGEPARTREEILAGLDWVREAPGQVGRVEAIVRRPEPGERQLLTEAELDLQLGLVGDGWIDEVSQSTGATGPDFEAQVTLMSSRAATLVAGDDHKSWARAGDQLYVDLDVSVEALPPQAYLRIGQAVLRVTDEPHLGCGKFSRRFGIDASKVFNSKPGRALRLRGVNTRVIVPGRVSVGDAIEKLDGAPPPN